MLVKFALSALALVMFARESVAAPSTRPVDNVNPFIGTGAHGHTFPGATLPFGLVQLSPNTPMGGWDGCSGYHYSDSILLGFSHTHLSGTGIGDLGDVLILPVVGDLAGSSLDCRTWQSPFSHANEYAEPGYYRVKLDRYDITAELTATERTGLHRYTFPAAAEGHLVIDLVRGINNRTREAALKVESSTMLSGTRTTTGWSKQRPIYFAIEFSRPWDAIGFERDGKTADLVDNAIAGEELRARVSFRNPADKSLLVRVGISGTSAEDAKKNLEADLPGARGWDFDAIRRAAKDAWAGALSTIEIDTWNPEIRRIFYTALYHSQLAPTLFNNADGTYRGPDGKKHAESSFQYYTQFSLWDTYRAQHPLLTVIQPSRVNDFVQSLLVFPKQRPEGGLPMWALQSYDTGTMIGYHAAPVIAEAYLKGFRGFDADFALEAMRQTALLEKNGQGEYTRNGYLSTPPGARTRGAAKTLEFSVDDGAIAAMATAMGKSEIAAEFSKRAQNYRNTWDPSTRFFRGRNPDGSFNPQYDPTKIDGREFAEANAWQYAFAAVHDVPGMIELYGGRDSFVDRLDELFHQPSDIKDWRVDITGLVGQYAHGNEPCHAVAYLYALAGQPHKTARLVRQIMTMLYDTTPEGLCGNDDCGQLSAWYVWSALGLYPVNPTDGRYVLGSPMVRKAQINLDPQHYAGKTFTILAPEASNEKMYIQSATLNGKPLERPWITHEEITNGGTLVLEMGVMPSTTWCRTGR